MTARTSVISIASSGVTGRTEALRLRGRMISPSFSSWSSASLTAPLDVSYLAASSFSTRRWLGPSSPW